MAADLENAILDVAQKHGRYKPNAYKFTLDAVRFTTQALEENRHVSGEELLDGIRKLALERFGPMAKTVFEQWGVSRTEDFGEIVFQLVDEGLLGKTEQDKLSDFSRGYDFHEAFVRNFDWLGRIVDQDPAA
ncbi:MAG TPA: Minf_1886 family protein [Candidatus Polarisedimenticolia bacterium]|nr:Minf_1886 family protein [Candidatus Polarisedimenticolia bacterium]